MKDTRIAKMIGEQIASGRGIVGRVYVHTGTGSRNDREGWIAAYDAQELEERGIDAEAAFDEDEGRTLMGADIWEGTIEGRKLRAVWLDDQETHEVEIDDISAAAAALGRKGRAVNSEAQQATARANGAKGGRPKMRRVMVKGRYGDGMAVEIILRDGKTATRGQYESAVRRLGGHNPVNSGLVLADKSEGEIPVYDGDQPWAMLS